VCLHDLVISHRSNSSLWAFKIKYTRTPIYSFVSNEASVLDHIAPIYFSIFSIVVVLHAGVNECTPMLGFTRIGLSFLDTSEPLGCHHNFIIA
jgi:hypothetical protein